MKYLIPIFVFILFAGFFYPKQHFSFSGDQLIVWNVGQGQMVTYLSQEYCHHFDMGGESKFFPQKKLFLVCGDRKNEVRYTHWDWDHINFSSKAKKILPSLCRVQSALESVMPNKKKRFLQKIPYCAAQQRPDIIQLDPSRKSRPKNSNESSLVFIVKNKILIPGDSNQRMEAYWIPQVKARPIHTLILGHHGSRYSTSWNLLNALPQLKLGIPSARRKRYGHPHKETLYRLKQRGVRVIRTEFLGHIRIPLNFSPPRAAVF